jgi:hypothetical protein
MSATKLASLTLKACFIKDFSFKDNLGDVLTVGGQAFAYKEIKSKYGDSIALQGAFVAVNLLTGEVFESQVAFLPKGISEQIAVKLKEGEAVVEFQAKICTVASDKNPAGYAWIDSIILPEHAAKRHEELVSGLVAASQSLKRLAAPETNAPSTKAKK